MTSVARDANFSLWSGFDVQPSRQERATARPSNDAELGIQEVEALRQVDVVAPAELAEPLVKLFAGELTSGDHLRLPQMTTHDGPAIQSAISRVLEVDTASGGASKDAVVKEEKMRRVLVALQYATQEIQRQANLGAAGRY
jgi:hypothetical protein